MRRTVLRIDFLRYKEWNFLRKFRLKIAIFQKRVEENTSPMMAAQIIACFLTI